MTKLYEPFENKVNEFGSALIDIAEAFGKLDGRGTSYKFRFESSQGKVYPKR